MTRDRLRLMLINDTRIIIINTIDDNIGENRKINWIFETDEGEKVRLANSLVISSKFMWNTYSYLKFNEYFLF